MTPGARSRPRRRGRSTKRYSGTAALAGVDFASQPGQRARAHRRERRRQVHAGEDSRGRRAADQSGELLFDGAARFDSPRRVTPVRAASSIIHQELQLFPDLSVAENLFVGRERRTRWGTIDRARAGSSRQRGVLREARPSARSAIALVGSLPLGQQQIVEIARALVHDTRVLMMDEPTSALTASEIPILFGVIRDLRAHGVVDRLHLASSRRAARDRGHASPCCATAAWSASAPRADVDVPWIVRRMTGRDAAVRRRDRGRRAPGEPVLVGQGPATAAASRPDRPRRCVVRRRAPARSSASTA